MSHEDIPTWIGFFLMCLVLTILTTKIIIQEKREVISWEKSKDYFAQFSRSFFP